MITWKTFSGIAKVISEIPWNDPENKAMLVNFLCKHFAEDNPKFNPQKFREACYVQEISQSTNIRPKDQRMPTD